MKQMWNRQKGADNRPKKPAPRRLRHPKDFPSPTLDILLRRITNCGKESARRMKADSERKTGRDHKSFDHRTRKRTAAKNSLRPGGASGARGVQRVHKIDVLGRE